MLLSYQDLTTKWYIRKEVNIQNNVDYLSRKPVTSKLYTDSAINTVVNEINDTSINYILNPQLTHETLKEETRKDEYLSKILKELQENRSAEMEFTLDNDILFRGHRVVVPSSLQSSVLKELHHTHIGITKMKQLARRYVYWKTIDKEIERVVRECASCAATKKNPPKCPLHPWEEPDHNWQRIHIDYAGPYQGHYFLVIMDAKSKWAEIEICRIALTSLSTIELLQNVFSRYGFPDVMVSDNATIFTSEVFTNFCKKGGIYQKFIAPGHPATNGLAERNVQTLKNRLTAMIEEPLSMSQKNKRNTF